MLITINPSPAAITSGFDRFPPLLGRERDLPRLPENCAERRSCDKILRLLQATVFPLCPQAPILQTSGLQTLRGRDTAAGAEEGKCRKKGKSARSARLTSSGLRSGGNMAVRGARGRLSGAWRWSKWPWRLKAGRDSVNIARVGLTWSQTHPP